MPILMIGVKVNSKSELVEDRERNSALYVVVTRQLPRDGGMAEDHGAPEAGQFSRAWVRGRKETESRQTAGGAKSPLLDGAE